MKRVENLFILNLSVKIKNNESNLKIEVDTIANFLFEKVENIDDISSFFYNNSSAILFPYIRAYISTLTNLSGNKIFEEATVTNCILFVKNVRSENNKVRISKLVDKSILFKTPTTTPPTTTGTGYTTVTPNYYVNS